MLESAGGRYYLGGICFITEGATNGLGWAEMTRAVIDAGVRWVQYRDKFSDRSALYHNALELRRITRAAGAFFIINDHADIAVAVDADGVHLGQEDLPLREARNVVGRDKMIGISTHSVEEALRAEREGADYIGFGPVFHTATKKEAGAPCGTDLLTLVRSSVRIPVVAIGGITAGHMPELRRAGAQAVAVASGILKGEIRDNVKRFISALN